MNRQLIAPLYASEEQAFFDRRGADVDLAWLTLAPGMSVLDLGCGPGAITRRIARIVWPGRVIGIDADPVQVDFAERRAEAEGIDNVAFVRGDACDPPRLETGFDVVVSHTLLMHLTDPLESLRKQREVVKRGGLVAALSEGDWGTMAAYPRSAPLEQAIDLLVGEIRSRGGDPEIGRRLPALFRSAGFESVCVSEAPTGPAVVSGSDLAGGPWLAILHDLLRRAARAGMIDAATCESLVCAVRQWCERPEALLIWPRTIRAKARR
jgi:SAM-dependent methyltransferase